MAFAVPDPWAVVLAAGEGKRLRALTRLLHPEDRPKQFAEITQGRSLLQSTLDRVSTLYAPERTLVVVGADQVEIARRQLALYPGVELVIQPRNRGTALGILLPLARIRARAQGALVTIFPSDHHVPRAEPLLRAVATAASAASRAGIVMIGTKAEGAETEYGWIVTGPRPPGAGPSIRSIRRFVEKPDRAQAERLLEEGALWNVFITTGRVEAIWEETRRHLPATVHMFDRYVGSVGQADEPMILDYVYSQAPDSNFSSDVLGKASGLWVVREEGSGWSDWGAPGRVFQSLRGTPDLEHLLRRINP
jgi:mannose-1-phosphate guanylyltransferase